MHAVQTYGTTILGDINRSAGGHSYPGISDLKRLNTPKGSRDDEPKARDSQRVQSDLNTQSKPSVHQSRLEISLHKESGRFVYRSVEYRGARVRSEFPSVELLNRLISVREEYNQPSLGHVLDLVA